MSFRGRVVNWFRLWFAESFNEVEYESARLANVAYWGSVAANAEYAAVQLGGA